MERTGSNPLLSIFGPLNMLQYWLIDASANFVSYSRNYCDILRNSPCSPKNLVQNNGFNGCKVNATKKKSGQPIGIISLPPHYKMSKCFLCAWFTEQLGLNSIVSLNEWTWKFGSMSQTGEDLFWIMGGIFHCRSAIWLRETRSAVGSISVLPGLSW
jgi:hypothetical protein